MARTIASKLTRIYLIVAVLVLFFAGLVSQLYAYHHSRTVAHENLSTQAVALAGNLESAVTFADGAFAQQTLNALQHYPDVRMAAVILPSGKYLASYLAGDGPEGDAHLEINLAQGNFMATQSHGVVQTIAGSGVAATHLVMVASLEKLNHEMELTALAGLAIACVILLGAYKLFSRMSRQVTRPLEQLTSVMRHVERRRDYQQRAQVVSNDEIGELAEGFNAMLGALETQNTSLITELDERKRMQEQLDHLAHFDAVTRLPNRHYFHDRLKISVAHGLATGQTMAVLFVDLDNFKLINDSYGHHVGDVLLQTVGARLTSALRAGDLVCRLGGDEFAIILENLVDLTQMQPLIEKLIQQLAQPLRLDNHDLVISGSIGAALCPEDADNPETLLRYADAAMYAAKADGKNTWRRFNVDMVSQSTLRLTLESQMRLGLAAGQFEVHYQPQIDLASGQVIGVEALARWRHPELGEISPVQFIPVAEDCGFIRQLGEWVLRSACRQIVQWHLAGYTQLKVAVNVSVRQLAHADFAANVLDILAETACSANFLELEITESVLMRNGGRSLELLEALQQCGIRSAMDYFGAGYSSMAQLKNMPVSKLKIDKSFVDEITSNRSDLAITTAMISLGNILDLQVMTEGVESLEQVLLLRQAGCHCFQGHYFARPMPAEQVADFIDVFAQEHPETSQGIST